MRTREDLQYKLEELLGSKNVYFQPVTNTQLKYPCIVYSLNTFNDKYADNKRYAKYSSYSVTHIYQKYSSRLQEAFMDGFDYIHFDGPARIDGLYHDTYTIHI